MSRKPRYTYSISVIKAIKQGVENPTPKSFDSERNQLGVWLSARAISSAIKLRKWHCVLSQALKQSPFETAGRPSWVFTADKARLGKPSQDTQKEIGNRFSEDRALLEMTTPLSCMHICRTAFSHFFFSNPGSFHNSLYLMWSFSIFFFFSNLLLRFFS